MHETESFSLLTSKKSKYAKEEEEEKLTYSEKSHILKINYNRQKNTSFFKLLLLLLQLHFVDSLDSKCAL